MRSEPNVRHILAPTLKRGDVVVLDNLPAHKVAGVREAIAERRARSSTCRPTALT